MIVGLSLVPVGVTHCRHATFAANSSPDEFGHSSRIYALSSRPPQDSVIRKSRASTQCCLWKYQPISAAFTDPRHRQLPGGPRSLHGAKNKWENFIENIVNNFRRYKSASLPPGAVTVMSVSDRKPFWHWYYRKCSPLKNLANFQEF